MVNEDGSLDIIRGDSIRIPLEFVDANNVPMDLTGSTFIAQCRSKPNGYILFEFDIETDLPAGKLILTVDNIITEAIRLPMAYWDLQKTSADGFVETVIRPTEVVITKDISIL